MANRNLCKDCNYFEFDHEGRTNYCNLNNNNNHNLKSDLSPFGSCLDFEKVTNYGEQAKQIEGKTDWSLMPLSALKRIIEVREYGNKKYHSPDNWKEVEAKHYINAIIRHTERLQSGELIDSESGLHHGAHIACSGLFLTELMKG